MTTDSYSIYKARGASKILCVCTIITHQKLHQCERHLELTRMWHKENRKFFDTGIRYARLF